MTIGRYLPTLPEVSREALAVVAGAIIAAIIFKNLPALKDWVASNLPTGTPGPSV